MTPEWISSISGVVLVAATLVYVFFTYRLTKETTKLREVETNPFISIFIRPTFPLSLVIENIGKGPAYEIEITFDKKYLECFLMKCAKNKIQMSYFSPNQDFTILLKQYQELQKLPYDSFPINIKYFSKDGKEFRETFQVEWKFLSSSTVEKDELEQIGNKLENISKNIEKMTKTIKEKHDIFITNKLKILEFEFEDNDIVRLVFSNGSLIKVPLETFGNFFGIDNPKDLMLINGDLLCHKQGLTYLAEEIYSVIKENR